MCFEQELLQVKAERQKDGGRGDLQAREPGLWSPPLNDRSIASQRLGRRPLLTDFVLNSNPCDDLERMEQGVQYALGTVVTRNSEYEVDQEKV